MTIHIQLCITCESNENPPPGPDIAHGSLAQYQYNGTGTEAGQFAEAVYECDEGHSLADPRISSLFCQNGTWRGEMPRCLASPGSESGDRVWCDQGDMGGCDQLCFSQGEHRRGQWIITLEICSRSEAV